MANWNGHKYGAGRYCYQCKEREVGCHSKCDKYKQAHKKAKEWSDFVEKKKNEEKEINQYKRVVSIRANKKRRQNNPK